MAIQGDPALFSVLSERLASYGIGDEQGAYVEQQIEEIQADRAAKSQAEAEEVVREHPELLSDPQRRGLLESALQHVQIGVEPGDTKRVFEAAHRAGKEVGRADRVNLALDQIFGDCDGRDVDGLDWLGNPMPKRRPIAPEIEKVVTAEPLSKEEALSKFHEGFNQAAFSADEAWDREVGGAVKKAEESRRMERLRAEGLLKDDEEES